MNYELKTLYDSQPNIYLKLGFDNIVDEILIICSLEIHPTYYMFEKLHGRLTKTVTCCGIYGVEMKFQRHSKTFFFYMKVLSVGLLSCILV